MELLTHTLRQSLPKIGATANDEDPMVWAKFFYPDGAWTWYLMEFDGEDECFGLVDGFERELGYFSLQELRQTRGRLGCTIEHDLYFTPCRLSELR